MDQSLKFKLSLAGIPCTSLSQFCSGFPFYDLMLHKLPRTKTLLNLKQRLKSNALDKPKIKAQEVVNLNVLLKYLRKEVKCPEHIAQLSVFKIIENQQNMKMLIEWMLSLNFEGEQKDIEDSLNESQIQIRQEEDSLAVFQNKHSSGGIHQNKQHEIDYAQRETELTNLYFITDKENYPHQGHCDDEEDYSMNIPKQQVLKSNSSIKIIKPRTSFNNDSFLSHQSYQENPSIVESAQKIQKLSMPPRPQIPPLPRQQQRGNESPCIMNQIQKSTSKISQREGNTTNRSMIRSNEKANSQTEMKAVTTSRTHHQKNNEISVNEIKEFPVYESKKDLRIKQLQKQVRQIQKSIGKEKREIVSLRRSNKSMKKNIQIEPVSSSNKQLITQWLISINLLNSLVRGKADQLPKICKKGVIFPQLINQKKQRSDEEIRYESKPTKSAQIHANYRRVFDYLSKLNNFNSNFLYSYENFVPEISQNVFWAFMLELMNYYKGTNKKKTHSMSKTQEQAERPSAPPVKTEREEYEKIRFSLQHKSSSKPFVPRKRQTKQDSDEERQERPLKHKKIEQNAMIQPRIDTNNSFISVSSYQQLRLKKEMFAETPKRQQSCKKQYDSVDKTHESRLSLKNSKATSVEEIPETTAEMQKVAAAYIKSQYTGIDLHSLLSFKEMFEDPVRNGTLLMLVVCRHFNLKAQQFIIKPTSISDCRFNLSKALNIIRQKQPAFPSVYLTLTQQILKGNKMIFYGIIFHLVHKNHGGDTSFNQSFTNPDEHKEAILNWVRSLKPNFQMMRYIEIDTFESVIEYMSTGILLNELASLVTKRTLKLVYDKPQYHVQYRANIMKTLEALAEKQVVEKEYLWKAKKISIGDTKTIVMLLDILKRKLTSFGWVRNSTLPFQQLIKAYCTK